MAKTSSPKKEHNSFHSYHQFDQINGLHPFQKACPDSFVPYQARVRRGGKLAYFNFDLAKEMGLIDQEHPEKITAALSEKMLETFSIIIINEFDQINNRQFPAEDLKPNAYMATKYLQLQHPNKTGLTSGDGRSIWNGVFKGNGKTWDISSCGTGATRLSPATAIQNKFFESGDPSISYGCGYSEIDEGLSTLFFSEVFYRNEIETERVLGIIEFPKGISINIRVHQNLLRPSHFFCHLKQGNYQGLKNVMDYYIDRQKTNGTWTDLPKTEHARYDYFLRKMTDVFAKLSAKFEDEYIFCWLDWDGDNILMDGSIIDYGSIRQFGLFHHEYRYDDVQRFSTSILEQKQKARYIIQCFAQVVDFLKTSKKRPLNDFVKAQWAQDFDASYSESKRKNLVYKLGFTKEAQDFILKKLVVELEEFSKTFSYFEMAKSKKGIQKVADGINCSAIYCMRDILRELPQIILARESGLEIEEFIEIIKSNYASAEDLKENQYRNKMVALFQQQYIELVERVAKNQKTTIRKVLLDISLRSALINKYERVTGDSITTIVHKVLKLKPKLTPEQIFEVARDFSHYQNLNPDKKPNKNRADGDKVLRHIFKIVREYREGL